MVGGGEGDGVLEESAQYGRAIEFAVGSSGRENASSNAIGFTRAAQIAILIV